MMETLTEIRETLSDLGEQLVFDSGTIYGILEIERTFLEGPPSFSTVEAVEFNYLVSSQDYVDAEIIAGAVFTNTDGIFTYTFEVTREALHAGDGWARMSCNLTSKEPV